MIYLGPLNVAERHKSVNGAINVIEKTELAESEVEEGLPDAKVGLVEVEDDGDVVADVDELDGGGTRSSRVDGASGKGVGGLGPGCEGGVGSRGEVAEIHGYGSSDGWAGLVADARNRRLGVQRKQVTGRKEKLIPCRLDSLGEYDRMH